jgi:hypothetical protein
MISNSPTSLSIGFVYITRLSPFCSLISIELQRLQFCTNVMMISNACLICLAGSLSINQLLLVRVYSLRSSKSQSSALLKSHLTFVAAACGHMSCFWCVHKAMDYHRQSYCAICRQPYIHFPSICQLLHHLLLKLEPVEYKKREKEVLGECSPLCLQEAIFLRIKCLFMLSTQHAWRSDVLTKLNHVGNCSSVFFLLAQNSKIPPLVLN